MATRRGQTFEIAASLRVLNALEAELADAPNKARRGALRALNRSLRTGKSAASQEIRQVINLKKKPVDARIRSRVISQRALAGSVAVRDRRIELVEFMSRAQIATAYRRGRARRSQGVPVKVYKKQARQVYPDTFLELGRRDRQWHVLKRSGREQYPIYIQYGPNMTSDFEKRLPAFAEKAGAVLQANLERELAAVLRGF